MDALTSELSSELSSTAKVMTKRAASDSRRFVLAYYASLKPRTTIALSIILLFQTNKLFTWWRSTSIKDPTDRMMVYPASKERRLEGKEEEEEEVVVVAVTSENEDGKMKKLNEKKKKKKILTTTTIEKSGKGYGGGYMGEDLDDDARILKRAGLKKLADVVRGKGVRFNRQTLRLLRSMRHFACIGDADSAAIYTKMKRIQFRKNTVVIHQGEEVTSGMYIVIRGRLVVYRKSAALVFGRSSDASPAGSHPTLGNRLSSWGPGTTLGENDVLEALATHDNDEVPRRQISVVADEDTDVLQLDLESFRWVLQHYPGAIVSWILSTTSRQWRVATYTLGEVLGLPRKDVRDWDMETVPIGTQWNDGRGGGSSGGGSCGGSGQSSGRNTPSSGGGSSVPPPRTTQRSSSDRRTLESVTASASGTINLLSGETVYNQGDIPSSCFVVVRGTVCGFVVDKHGSNGRMLFEAGPGSILGGVAVVGDVPMQETVSCLTDTVLAVYPKVLLSEVATVDAENDGKGGKRSEKSGVEWRVE